MLLIKYTIIFLGFYIFSTVLRRGNWLRHVRLCLISRFKMSLCETNWTWGILTDNFFWSVGRVNWQHLNLTFWMVDRWFCISYIWSWCCSCGLTHKEPLMLLFLLRHNIVLNILLLWSLLLLGPDTIDLLFWIDLLLVNMTHRFTASLSLSRGDVLEGAHLHCHGTRGAFFQIYSMFLLGG